MKTLDQILCIAFKCSCLISNFYNYRYIFMISSLFFKILHFLYSLYFFCLKNNYDPCNHFRFYLLIYSRHLIYFIVFISFALYYLELIIWFILFMYDWNHSYPLLVDLNSLPQNFRLYLSISYNQFIFIFQFACFLHLPINMILFFFQVHAILPNLL